MTAERLAEIRNALQIITLTPGQAVQADLYEEYQEALAAAPQMLREMADHATELRCLADLAARRCADWHECASILKERNTLLLYRSLAAEHRKPQNDLLRDLLLRERKKRREERIRFLRAEAENDAIHGVLAVAR